MLLVVKVQDDMSTNDFHPDSSTRRRHRSLIPQSPDRQGDGVANPERYPNWVPRPPERQPDIVAYRRTDAAWRPALLLQSAI